MIRANGITQAVNASASTGTAAGILIGGRFQSGAVDTLYRARITVCEVLRWDRALSAAEYASVEAYLAAKWGIAGVHTPATATSDPVGYWGDKSGNGRHAVQATAGSRPTVGASSTAGKNAVRNNGTGSVALQVAAWPYTAGNTQFAVFNGSTINQGIAQRGSLNDEPRMAIQTGANGVASLRATRGGSVLAQTHSEAGYPLSQWAIGATLFNTSLGRAYRDGVYGADTTDSQAFSGDQELRLLSLPSNIYGINGGIAEFLYYDRQLNAVEVDRVARYLSSRWGITLAPQVSNADAQDWINRVYSNGGTVSASTAAAVNTLCDSLDAASLRDRFYRLNLFCGTGLNAALVPLYRGPSLGGTQYGNATDTNVGPFVSGDFADATGLAAGSGKYLRTGLTQANVGTACHLAFYDCVKATNSYANRIGSRGASDTHEHAITTLDVATTIDYASSATAGAGRARATGYTQAGAFWLGVNPSATSAILYKNGVSAVTSTPSARTAQNLEYWAFGLNNNGALDSAQTTGRSGGYSIGAAMDATQAAAYNAAMQAFQTALTRNAT
jgi:hypothetical protein